MRHAAQKKVQPVTTRQTTIYLLEGHTTIQLPVPENGVRKLQAELASAFTEKPLKVARG